jgi:hypothetical protein
LLASPESVLTADQRWEAERTAACTTERPPLDPSQSAYT